jgi:hypothetical protein
LAILSDVFRPHCSDSGRSNWKDLVKLFKGLDSDSADGIFIQGVAVALAHSYGPLEFDEMIALCKDQTHGDVRILLSVGLRRSRKVDAEKALRDLTDDPQIGEQVSKWIRHKEVRRKNSIVASRIC